MKEPVLCPAAMFSVAGAIVIALGVPLASDTVTPPVPARLTKCDTTGERSAHTYRRTRQRQGHPRQRGGGLSNGGGLDHTVAVTSSSGGKRHSAGGHAAIGEEPALCPAAMFSVAGAIVIALGVLLASDTVTPPVPAA